MSKSLKAAFVSRSCLTASLQRGASAQQVEVGDNVNVLPVVNSGDELDYLRGDLYGQRQGEPDIAFSSLNPDHAMAIYNDFRAVDVPDDASLPDFNTSTVARLWTGARTLLARVLGRPGPKPNPGPPVAAVEAGIGMSVTYDGGITWTGGFMPGLPFDDSPASVRFPRPAGGDERPGAPERPLRQVLRLLPGLHPRWPEQADAGQVPGPQQRRAEPHDQVPRLHADRLRPERHERPLPRQAVGRHHSHGRDQLRRCDRAPGLRLHDVHRQRQRREVPERINFAKSVDGGRSFAISGIDKTYTQNQGNSVVVNPVTKQVVVFWRSFNSPHTIVMRKQQTNGTWANPVDILANDSLKTLANFDQTTVSTTSVPVGAS